MNLKRLLARLLLLSTGACAALDGDAAESEAAATAAPPKQPLDAIDEDGLYHWSEGSELLPYFAVRALRVLARDDKGQLTDSETDDFFLSEKNLARYGFIADKRGPERRSPDKIANDEMPDGARSLPIGMTLARAPDTGFVSLGTNCAACHVAQITAGGKTEIINGAPNMFDLAPFFADIVQHLSYIAKSGGRHLKTSFGARALKELARTKLKFRGLEDEVLGTRDSTLDQVELVFKLVGNRADWDAAVDKLDVSRERKALLRARKDFVDSVIARVRTTDPPTVSGFGRADAVSALKSSIFFGHGFTTTAHAPISYPPMFNIETAELFHTNGFTNSVAQRNIGQSLGQGAISAEVVDGSGKKKVVATTHVTNLFRMERALYKIAPPAWVGPRRDEAAAARGKDLYRRECKDCHEPTPLESGLHRTRLFPIAKIGTDPAYLSGVGDHIVPSTGPQQGQDLGHGFALLAPLVQNVEAWYRDAHNGELERQEESYAQSSPAAARIAEARKQIFWRTTNTEADQAYLARPLDGVWATAPFLHNGSVPSLLDLLAPAKDRPRAFCVGHREYDLERVGYTLVTPKDGRCPAGEVLIDTDADSAPTRKGNSNRGHEFGTTLTDTEKRDLLEFLKGLGAGASRPTLTE